MKLKKGVTKYLIWGNKDKYCLFIRQRLFILAVKYFKGSVQGLWIDENNEMYISAYPSLLPLFILKLILFITTPFFTSVLPRWQYQRHARNWGLCQERIEEFPSVHENPNRGILCSWSSYIIINILFAIAGNYLEFVNIKSNKW